MLDQIDVRPISHKLPASAERIPAFSGNRDGKFVKKSQLNQAVPSLTTVHSRITRVNRQVNVAPRQQAVKA
jgi:hypothetical protein